MVVGRQRHVGRPFRGEDGEAGAGDEDIEACAGRLAEFGEDGGVVGDCADEVVLDSGLRIALVEGGGAVGDEAVTVEGPGGGLGQRRGLGKRGRDEAFSAARGR